MPGRDENGTGTRLFFQECRFVGAATGPENIPHLGLPEIAFSGRSNVGKSSLLNALTNRKNLARTSSQPGRTQTLNFFSLADRLSLVDLPGYGYARASKKSIAAWTRLIETYLQTRSELQRVVVLIDARRGVMEPDLSWMETLGVLGLSFQIVPTKFDALKQAERDAFAGLIAPYLERFPSAYREIIPTSAQRGDGIEALRASLADLAANG